MIQSLESFIAYFEGIRRRTITYIQTIPADRVDWSPAAGELSCAEIVRHLAAGERMFCGVVATGRWHYVGHAGGQQESLESLLALLASSHAAAIEALRPLDDSVLSEPRPTLNGPPAKAWRLLMAMVEHEIHHRSQLAVYLTSMGVAPPQIYGLSVEDVIALATG
jgi:uncharacterized damage-inducible protein DinB